MIYAQLVQNFRLPYMEAILVPKVRADISSVICMAPSAQTCFEDSDLCVQSDIHSNASGKDRYSILSMIKDQINAELSVGVHYLDIGGDGLNYRHLLPPWKSTV